LLGRRVDAAGHDPLGVIAEDAFCLLDEPPNEAVDELVAHVASVAPRHDVAAEPQTRQMRRDARLVAADVPHDLARGPRTLEEKEQDLHPRRIGEPVKEARELALVGLTDTEANARGHTCMCNTIPMHLVPRAGVARDERGIIKMVRERGSDRVLGVSMVGRDAGEVIHEAAMAMRFGATVHDFIDMVHVYPTMAEALKIVALSFFKDVSKMSCCAE
jgi:pyruvate/2-oxoglutarate dehydrogenase complex dihydrolipoamide dehydrogenase (E3) component